jgi:hypothetical protein
MIHTMGQRNHKRRRLTLLLAATLSILSSLPTAAQEASVPPVVPPASVPSLQHRLLWYLPNRFLDLFDLFRARVRIGPGLALNIRCTRWADFYAGEYHALYLGLPGPREAPVCPIPAGLEQEKGLSLLGVDATDSLPHEPGYSDTEFTVGAHLLLVGAEVGFDPVEAADFALGFFLLDPRRDDH